VLSLSRQTGSGRPHAPIAPSYYHRTVHYGDGLPNAEKLPEDLVRLSMSPSMQEQDIADMAQAVQKVAEAYSIR
jgi:dTDP-4-amino-4,6-dideoxygalactose transaminase